MPSNDDLLATLAAERAIKDALVRFCRGADRRDDELIRSAFHPDAYDDHGAYAGDVEGFIRWQRERHADIPQCMHLLGNCTIEIDGRQAFTETYCLAVVSKANADGSFSQSSIACRYIDRFEERETGWRIAHRHVSYDWMKEERLPRLLPDGLSGALRSKDDVSYRIRELEPA